MIARVTVDAALRQPHRRVARRRVRLSAAGEGGGRSPADEGRRARGRGPHQGARRGQAHVRRGQGRGPQGDAGRAGASEHVHDERGQHRPAATRSWSRSSTRRRCATTRAPSACAFRWRSRRATSPATRARVRGTAHRLVGRDAGGASTPSASRRRSSPRSDGLVLPGAHRDRPRCRLSAGESGEHVSPDGHRVEGNAPLPADACRRSRARHARLRAGLDARRRRRHRAPRSSPRPRAARPTRC